MDMMLPNTTKIMLIIFSMLIIITAIASVLLFYFSFQLFDYIDFPSIFLMVNVFFISFIGIIALLHQYKPLLTICLSIILAVVAACLLFGSVVNNYRILVSIVDLIIFITIALLKLCDLKNYDIKEKLSFNKKF